MTPLYRHLSVCETFFSLHFLCGEAKKAYLCTPIIIKGPFLESLACVNSMFFGQACGS